MFSRGPDPGTFTLSGRLLKPPEESMVRPLTPSIGATFVLSKRTDRSGKVFRADDMEVAWRKDAR